MCSGPGKVPALTSSSYARAARSSSPWRSAYCLTKLAILPGAQPEGVLPDQHLAVALDAGADADGRDHQLLGDLGGDVAGDHLHHDGERAGVLNGVGIGEDPLGRVAAALDPVTAEGVLALRREPDVGHHRDAALAEPGDLRGHLDAALELHAVGEALLHEPGGGGVGLLGRGLVGAEREVADDERAVDRAADGAGQREQLVDGDRDGGLVGVDVVGRRVSDQEHVDAGLVEGRGGVLVVGGEHRELLAALLELAEVVGADPLHRACWSSRDRCRTARRPRRSSGCSSVPEWTVVAAPWWSPRNVFQASDVSDRMRPVSLVTGRAELVAQSAEGDLVVAGAGVRSGEPRGVLTDLVEPPLEVEQLDHLRVRADLGGRHPVLDEGAQVELGRGQASVSQSTRSRPAAVSSWLPPCGSPCAATQGRPRATSARWW